MTVKEMDNIFFIFHPETISKVIVLASCSTMAFSDHAQVRVILTLSDRTSSQMRLCRHVLIVQSRFTCRPL